MPKILFVVPHRPGRSPSQRFRFEQYIPYLEENGFECHFSYLISEKDDRHFYSPGNYLNKLKLFVKCGIKRFKDINRASSYDIIFIQREAFMTGSSFFEKKFKASGARVVYDFDDAIWLLDISDGNKSLKWLKKPGKTAELIRCADLVLAGNKYLSDFAENYNSNVAIIPTTIDTNYHVMNGYARHNSEKTCIGWTGTSTTLKHFELAIPVLRKLKEEYGERLEIKVIVDVPYQVDGLELNSVIWSKEKEISDLSGIDIGIMPLPDDEWAKGKCGFKGLQYMSLEIPAVMSPVGVNRDIIEDGQNGFLAESQDEWLEKLKMLIENKELRSKIGRKARETIERKYSVDANKRIYLEQLRTLVEKE